MSDTITTHIIALEPASKYRQESYGILYESRLVHKIKGARHNPRSSFTFKVWDNTSRPNPHPGEVRYLQYGAIGGDGRYLDPHNVGTDDEISVTTSPEPVVISRHPFPRPKDGETLAIGDVVELVAPGVGSLGAFTIAQKSLHDPHLIPVIEAEVIHAQIEGKSL